MQFLGLRSGGGSAGTSPAPVMPPVSPSSVAVPGGRLGRVLQPWSWSRRARLGGLLGVGAVAAAGSTLIYLVDPAQPGHYPTCPFKAVTGLDCPGCGSMRALHQALHGHLGAAANYNLLFVAFAPFLAGCWLVRVAELAGLPLPRPPGWLREPPSWLSLALVVVVFAFWAVRNSPGPVGHWLHS